MKNIYRIFKNNKRNLIYIPLVLYWVLIFILTSLPSDAISLVVSIGDKVNHLLAYFGLAFLLNFTLHFQSKISLTNMSAAILTIIIAGVYGAADELHQNFVPGRFPEFLDWIANVLGAFIGVLLVNFIIHEGSKKLF